MSSSINVAVISGNLVRDPEIRETGVGSGVCSFTVAVNRKYKEKEAVSFIKVTAWGKLGEICNEYLAKGRGVIVSGRMEQERWESDSGAKERTGIVANDVRFMPQGGGGEKNPSYDHNDDAGGGIGGG